MESADATAAPKSRFSWLVATFFGIGHLQPGSGTWAAAITVLLWWAASHWIPPSWLVAVAIMASAAINLLGIPTSTVVARERCIKNPGFVVVEEDDGPIIARFWVSPNLEDLFAGFLRF